MWGLNILEGPFNDIVFNVVNRIADQFCSCEAWLMLVVHFHKTGHFTVESQRWKEKPCEGDTDWEGGEGGRGEGGGAGGETMWERGWGWHRLPVSHLQFPSMSVIRGALWRAAWWRASSRIFWSNFSVNNSLLPRGQWPPTASSLPEFDLFSPFCNLQTDGLILQAVICNEGWSCPRLHRLDLSPPRLA